MRTPKVKKPKPKIKNPAKIRAQLAQWFEQFGRDLPWRRTHDPYAIMVSEFMLQQTQVATVIPYFERWLRQFPDFNTLAAANEAEVLAVWQGLGYYARARNLHRAAKEVVSRHGGKLPPDPEAIAALPGVGRYTAGAIASFAFDLPVAAVDANIARVLARLLNLQLPVDSTAGATEVWEAAEALLPYESGGRLHTSALMELGALRCTPRQPQCLLCPVRDNCQAEEPELLPLKKPRKKIVPLEEMCEWRVSDRGILLEQQTGSRWRGMWKLPQLRGEIDGEALLQFDYPFTHHRVTLRVFETGAEEARLYETGDDQKWVAIGDLAGIAIAAPHRRAIQQLLDRGD